MKKSLKLLSLVGAVIFVLFFACACSPRKELKRVSKDLTAYNISATLNEDMTLDAHMSVKVKNTTSTLLSSLCFNLYPRAFREGASVKPYTTFNEGKCFPAGESHGDIEVKNICVQGESASSSLVGTDDNALEVKLTRELEPDEKVEISMDFSVKIPECTHRLGHFGGSVNLGNWYPVLAMYENGEFIIEPYYSSGDPFFSDIANYEVSLTYPSGFHLSSSGVKESESEGEGVRTDTLKSLATRDFAIALTSESECKSQVVNGTEVTYVGYSGDDDIDDQLDASVKALKFYSSTFGDYPYEKLDVVKAPFVHGGMEYPSLVIISDSVTDEVDFARVIAHEVAHQWWYAVVGNNQLDEAWLDESLAEYSSILFLEAHGEYKRDYKEMVAEAFAGYVLFADIAKTLDGKVNTSMLLPVNEYTSDYEYSYMIYIRGVLMLDEVRQLVGKQKLFDGLEKYYNKYKFKIATTDDFIETFTRAVKKDVSGLLDSWLSGSAVVGVI